MGGVVVRCVLVRVLVVGGRNKGGGVMNGESGGVWVWGGWVGDVGGLGRRGVS